MPNIPIRGEMWKLAYAPEATYGTDPGTIYYVNVLGVVQTGVMPDPEIELWPIWALGTASKRNWYITYKGKITLAGSIPDVWLLNGASMRWPIGVCGTVGADVSGGGGSTLSEDSARGAITITIASITGYAANDYIQVDIGSNAEVRQITNISGNILTLNYPLSYAHSSGATCNEVTVPYTHTIIEANTLDSLAMHLTINDADGNIELMRRFLGGKVNRATYVATEGEQLRMSFDELVFIDWAHNQSGEPKYNSDIADITPSYPTTEPYLFSYGALSLAGTSFARIRAFRLEVTNNAEAKYYVNYVAGISQLPTEYREGRREYRLSCTVDIEDASLYKDLIRQGTYSAIYKGFQTLLVFTRGSNDTITFTIPSTIPAAGGNAMGCLIRSAKHNIVDAPLVSTDLDIISRNLQIVVVDAVPVYP